MCLSTWITDSFPSQLTAQWLDCELSYLLGEVGAFFKAPGVFRSFDLIRDLNDGGV